MPKSKPTHHKAQSSVIPQIEHLLTEQTSVILQAVDEKLSAQDKRIKQGFAAQDKRIEQGFAAQDKRIEQGFAARDAVLDKYLVSWRQSSRLLAQPLLLDRHWL